MRQYYCVFLVFVLKSGIVTFAQEWTEQDSLWLQRVLNGTEKIQLNEETRKAIESGTFIHDPTVVKRMNISPLEMPVIKSFEGITAPQSKRISPTDMPSSVYRLYGLEHKDTVPHGKIIAMPKGSTATTFNETTIWELKLLDAFTPRKATVDDKAAAPSERNKKGNFEDALRSIFWPSHRAKIRNAKNANAWKTYNEGY
jgi:hypothetical protein